MVLPQSSEIEQQWSQVRGLLRAEVGDTAYYDPDLRSIVHYRGKRYVMVTFHSSGEQRIDEYACGTSGFHGAEGKYWGRYSDDALLRWADWIVEQARSGRSVWCYFNNDIHGHAIHDARTLKSMVGQMLQ